MPAASPHSAAPPWRVLPRGARGYEALNDGTGATSSGRETRPRRINRRVSVLPRLNFQLREHARYRHAAERETRGWGYVKKIKKKNVPCDVNRLGSRIKISTRWFNYPCVFDFKACSARRLWTAVRAEQGALHCVDAGATQRSARHSKRRGSNLAALLRGGGGVIDFARMAGNTNAETDKHPLGRLLFDT